MKTKIRIHLWTLPRWFVAPLFGSAAILGGLLAGGMTLYSWLGVIGVLLIMAGGHSFNTFLDYVWTGLDKGTADERSAEKGYTAGQSVIAAGDIGIRGVLINALSWYILALVPIIIVAINIGWPIILIGVLGMLMTFAYAKSKFNYTHELVLGISAGPLAVLGVMFATTANPNWVAGLVASVPSGILISFIGLAIDEYPDAEANLKKGVRSISYMVWQNKVSLEWYVTSWLLFLFLYQVFLIAAGILVPLSAISFFIWPFLMSFLVLSRQNFKKWAKLFIMVGVFIPVLLVIGQFFGR